MQFFLDLGLPILLVVPLIYLHTLISYKIKQAKYLWVKLHDITFFQLRSVKAILWESVSLAQSPPGILRPQPRPFCIWMSCHPGWTSQNLARNKSSWWFQPIWKNISQNGNLPQIGMKIKNIWNHHLDMFKCGNNTQNQYLVVGGVVLAAIWKYYHSQKLAHFPKSPNTMRKTCLLSGSFIGQTKFKTRLYAQISWKQK